MDRVLPPFVPGLGWTRSAKTSAYTVVAGDRGVVIDCTSGTFSVTFTAAATLGSGFSFGVYNSGAGTITLDPNGAETIRSPAGSAATLALSQGQGVWIQCDGTGFEVIADAGLAPSSGAIFPINVPDNQFTIIGSSDATKKTVWEVDTQGAGFTLTWDVGAQTASRSATMPVLTGSSILTLSNATLTTARVPFATTNGILTDSANLTFSGTLLTLGTGATGGLSIAATTGTTLSVASTANSATLASNSIFTSGGLGVTSDATIGGFLRTNTDVRVYSGASLTLWGKSSGSNGALDAPSGSLLLQSGSSTRFTMTSSLTTTINPIVVTLGAVTVSSPFFSGTQTWNNGATTFAAFSCAVTDSASAAGSLLMDFQVGGSTKISIGKLGDISVMDTTDATTSATGSGRFAGGLNVAKNVFLRQGLIAASTSVTTAAGTTTLTISSTRWQIFTGTTTQTCNLPAANVAGAGFGPEYIIKNESSGNVTVNRAGSDTIFTTASVTSVTLTTGQTLYLTANGSTKWSGFVV
jgi:hypothetical protein